MTKSSFNLDIFDSNFDQKSFLHDVVLSLLEQIEITCGAVTNKYQICEECDDFACQLKKK